MKQSLINFFMYPFKLYKDWQWKKTKKEFFTNKGKVSSNKFNRYARRIK